MVIMKPVGRYKADCGFCVLLQRHYKSFITRLQLFHPDVIINK